MALGMSAIAAGPAPVQLVISAAGLLGFGFSFPWSSVASTVLRETPSGQRGSAVGVLSAFYDLFVGVSSFAAGAVANSLRICRGVSPSWRQQPRAPAIAGRFVFPATTGRHCRRVLRDEPDVSRNENSSPIP